jgi:mannose/fructose/N-acetylgalactosamine-specific phosphotransferase system component IID
VSGLPAPPMMRCHSDSVENKQEMKWDCSLRVALKRAYGEQFPKAVGRMKFWLKFFEGTSNNSTLYN